jgi:hypothetical protein
LIGPLASRVAVALHSTTGSVSLPDGAYAPPANGTAFDALATAGEGIENANEA